MQPFRPWKHEDPLNLQRIEGSGHQDQRHGEDQGEVDEEAVSM